MDVDQADDLRIEQSETAQSNKKSGKKRNKDGHEAGI